jgi:butyryl-CoA dehydrogenase
MDFQLTKEQVFVRKMVREFAVNEVEPIASLPHGVRRSWRR